MRALLSVLVCVLVSLAACRDNGPTDPANETGAMYTLVQFNGLGLPFLVAQDATRQIEVVSGTLMLRRDSSFTEIINTRITPAAGLVQIVPAIRNGTFSLADNTLQFRNSDGAVHSGTRDGGTVSYSVGGASFTFRRQ